MSNIQRAVIATIIYPESGIGKNEFYINLVLDILTMTAVIGIINKSAAAIATDSAVTVTGPRGPKIFNRANKIFRISRIHPVGLMIYNQGEFMGTPWEVIIKLYRKHVGDKGFNTLEEYKVDFINFLHSNNFFCDHEQQKKMLYYLLCDLLQLIGRKCLKSSRLLFNHNRQTWPL